MRTGTLNHKIEIQEFTSFMDEIGQEIEEWAKIAEAWASISPLRGNEYFNARTTQAEITHKVIMRPPKVEVRPDNRLIFNERIFDIKSVLNIDERNRELELLCVERI